MTLSAAHHVADWAAAALRPRKRLSVSQWADAHRRLTTKSSSEPGLWRTARTPYLREPMDALSANSPTRKVVLMFAAQLGKTETGLNWLGYIMDHAPGAGLLVLPTINVRTNWIMQRLRPMIQGSERLAELVGGLKSRDGSNSVQTIEFPGGQFVLGGANSSASLRSMPIRYVLCDELDEFPYRVGAGLDPLDLIEQRTSSQRRVKICLISTPTIKGGSRIDEEYQRSDQRKYYVPCPHCGEKQVLKWGNLHWNAAYTDARYACEHCGAEMEEHHKPQMLAAGEWRPDNPGSPVRGYHLSALYSPIGLGMTWLQLAQDWREKHKDPVRLKTFINEKLGEPWEDQTHTIKPHHIAQRAEPYRLRHAPPPVAFITAGVDTQDDRLAIQVVGWGKKGAAWILDWFELPGDPARDEVWVRLADYLARPIAADGQPMLIQATAIDSGGHHTQDVYAFERSRRARRVMAIRGASTPGRPVVSRPSKVDLSRRGKPLEKGGARVWIIGSDTVKHRLYRWLSGDNGLAEKERRIHFSEDLPIDYYEQLTAETFDPDKNRFILRRGRRNEALDTWVYAYAAACHPEIRIHAMSDADFDRLITARQAPPEERPTPQKPASRRWRHR